MRSLFQEELAFTSDQLVEMSRLSARALDRATQSLMEADLALAEQVITDDEQIDALRRDLDNRSIDILARQQPVATDLRQLVTALRMSSDLERSGDLARHVAKLARLRYPHGAVPEELRGVFAEMAVVAREMVLRAGEIVAAHDPNGARELQLRDDTMDRLHREVFRVLLDPEQPVDTQSAIDATLLSRYYERFADHAVSVAIRVVYLVTGMWHDEQVPGAYESAVRVPPARD
ncbi:MULTISPECIES: phosphate signaling complex protein PhoU [unclassified Ornithinimicrobium]|uniref:phosphate signaling complex protein PhoU n=1 Tax=unclassified Ornithinimicrobium TaxID=2615080 RepID=UPI0038533918